VDQLKAPKNRSQPFSEGDVTMRHQTEIEEKKGEITREPEEVLYLEREV
jgi:hypothetical protein